jgi:hypothetical protein
MDTVTDSAAAFGQWVIDEMLERYICWREECAARTYAGHVERVRRFST